MVKWVTMPGMTDLVLYSIKQKRVPVRNVYRNDCRLKWARAKSSPPITQAVFRRKFLNPEKIIPLNVSSSNTAGIRHSETRLRTNGVSRAA